jgi:hypothetical protein
MAVLYHKPLKRKNITGGSGRGASVGRKPSALPSLKDFPENQKMILFLALKETGIGNLAEGQENC